MAKKKELFKGGGLFGNPSHEIKIAILLIFFHAELEFNLGNKHYKKNPSDTNIKELYIYSHSYINELKTILNNTFDYKNSIKFSDLKYLLKCSIDKLLPSVVYNSIKYKLFSDYDDTTSDQTIYNELSSDFMAFCHNLRIHHALKSYGSKILNKNGYELYMYDILNNKYGYYELKEKVIEVIKASRERVSKFDNYQLHKYNQFIFDIAGMCEIKMKLLETIIQHAGGLAQLKSMCVPEGERGRKREEEEKEEGEIARLVKEAKAKIKAEDKVKAEEIAIRSAEETAIMVKEIDEKARLVDTTVTERDDAVTDGGKKSKKLPKKEFLGKTKSIHKIPGDRKEYVKHKGKLVTIKDYKALMKQKAKPKKKAAKVK